MSQQRPRVMVVARQYPLLCETYIHVELEHLRRDYDLKVLSTLEPSGLEWVPDPVPYVTTREPQRMVEEAEAFRPHVLHGHWLIEMPRLHALARRLNVPFTIRAHSFDTLPTPYMKAWFESAPQVMSAAGNDPLCLGILAFPFSRPILERWGVPPEKIIDCFPVVDVERFLDRSPNGEGALNLGACLPKKAMGDYLRIAQKLPDMHFDLYPVAYRADDLEAINRQMGSPVEIHPVVPHQQMPAVFKAHKWLVYTANFQLANVGWPIAIAEAQASGCGVLMADIRPDIREYLGDAGFVYRSIDEAVDVLRQPVPEDAREKGFELAERSDVRRHLHLLTDLWRTHVPNGREIR